MTHTLGKHSPEIRCLCLLKWPSEIMLPQNLPSFFFIPYRRIYYAGVLISCGGFKWRYIQDFYPKTGVVIEFLLKKWTLGAKKWRCIQICQKWRNNQDWRSKCADTVIYKPNSKWRWFWWKLVKMHGIFPKGVLTGTTASSYSGDGGYCLQQ